MKRRELLTAGAALCGAFAAVSIERDRAAGDQTGNSAGNPADEAEQPYTWPYEEVDPDAAADYAYSLYPEGRCMYSAFRAVVELAGRARSAKHPEEKRHWEQFPYRMMFYGKTGVHSYGSLCGVLNGCAAAVSLLVPLKEIAAAMTRELFYYYESTAFPIYTPKESPFSNMEQSVAESVLCHVSESRWLAAAGVEESSPRRSDRCARLTADMVRKTVELLNRYYRAGEGEKCLFAPMPEPAASCVECHNGETRQKDVAVQMNCALCHDDLSEDHGK